MVVTVFWTGKGLHLPSAWQLSAAEPTIGAAYINKKITFEDEKQVELDIWDTAGNERFKDLAPMYYRGSHGALVVYDITDATSLKKAKSWIRELNEKVKKNIKYFFEPFLFSWMTNVL